MFLNNGEISDISGPSSQKSGRLSAPGQKPKTPGADPYKAAFGSRPKIPRTPDPNSMKRPSSRGSISQMPPAPQFSESGPRPSSAGKSG
jgi:hypothetical protein